MVWSRTKLLTSITASSTFKVTKNFTLADARLNHAPRGRRSWKSALNIGITGAHATEWNRFLNTLVSNYIHLSSEPDRLIWTKNTKTRQYTTKMAMR